MNTNLAPLLDDEIQSIIDTMVDRGWKQEDTAYVNHVVDINDKEVEVHIVFFPKLLFYRDTNYNTPWVTIPWICGRWFYNEMDDYLISQGEVIGELKNVIKHFTGLTPFKDEDALGGYLNMDDGEPCFYINPDFPEGYWANHTL